MLFLFVLSTHLVLQSVPHVQGQGNGAVRLVDMGTTSVYFGRVLVYFDAVWGLVCSDGFGTNEADVVCHQLGYVGATGFSKASNDDYGSDALPAQIGSIGCTGDELVLLQCFYEAGISCPDGDAVSVVCNESAIWSLPYNEQVRLMDGSYVTDGRVEIYCNDQWGTVCNQYVDSNAADTVCVQLGYSNAESYGNTSLPGNPSDPVWYDSFTCSQASSCVTGCQPCPQAQTSDCTHNNDLTIQCTFNKLVNEGSDITTCAASTGLSAGAILGIVLAVVVSMVTLVALAVAIPLVIYRCPGIFNCKKHASGFDDGGDTTFSSKDDGQVVMTGKYVFNLDHNPEDTEEDTPQV